MIEVLIGMIASGKGTWARKRAQEGWLVMNDDAIVTMLHGGDYTLYEKTLKPIYKSIENHIVQAAVLMGKNIVIDRGMDHTIAARQRWIALGRAFDTPVRAVLFERFPASVHGERRQKSDSRGHEDGYWLKVALAHEARWEDPTCKEGFSEIFQKAWIT